MTVMHPFTRRSTTTVLVCAVLALPGLTPPVEAQSRSIRVEIPEIDVRVDLRELEEALAALEQFDFDRFRLRFDGFTFDHDVSDVIDSALAGLDHLPSALSHLETLGHGYGRAFSAWGRLPAGAAQNRDFRVSQEDRQTLTLDVGTAGFLDLRNISGDVTVTRGSGSTARVEVVRTSHGRTEADARRGLDEVTVESSESGGGARVRVVYPQGRGRAPYSVSTNFTVSVPPGTRLTINSVSGDVSVRGVEGDLSIDVISGTVEISGARHAISAKSVSGNVIVTDVQTDAPVDVTTISGNTTLRDIRTTRLSANGVSGDIDVAAVETPAADMKTMAGDVTYAGAFARDGRYEFQSHSGDIELTLTGGVGFELRASTFSGDIRPDAGLSMSNVSTTRRTWRGQVGDGGATVSTTTFSGDVVIRRR